MWELILGIIVAAIAVVVIGVLIITSE